MKHGANTDVGKEPQSPFGPSRFCNIRVSSVFHPWLVDGEFHLAGYNIGANCGAAAGQTIFHLHPHVIPRYPNDVPNPRGGVHNLEPAMAEEGRFKMIQNSIGCMICKSLIRDSPE